MSATCGAVTACFQVIRQDTCNYRFDGPSSSTDGPIIEYSWQIDKHGRARPGQIDRTSPSAITNVNWGSTGGCSGESIEVLLDVKDAFANSCSVTGTGYVINLSTWDQPKVVETSFTSFLGIPPYDGTARGRVSLNNRRVDTTNNSTPFMHRWRSVQEKTTVEASTEVPFDGEGFWRFDFSAADHFVAGSIIVERGQVIFRDARTIVFRPTGKPGETIRCTFRLAP